MNLEAIAYVCYGIASAITIKLILDFVSSLYQFPPGPWGLPVVGYIPWIGKDPAKTFIKISKKYGNIFSVSLGGKAFVVLNDWQAIKMSIMDQPQTFLGRITNVTTNVATERKDVAFSDGPIWRVHRNLVVQCMKSAGIGKSAMEINVKSALHDLIEQLESSNNIPIEMSSLFFMPLMKVVWKLVANKNVKDANKEISSFNDDINCMFQQMGPDNLYDIFPWLRFIPPNDSRYKRFVKSTQKIKTYLTSIIKSHENKWIEGEENDFIDFYLSYMKREQAAGNSKPPYNSDYCMYSAFDMFLAAIETTSATMLWTFLFLLRNPEVLKKARKEMDSVVGRERLPCLDDYSRLPYMKALIMEVHRVATVGPLSVPHVCTRETRIGDIKIPKNAACLQNIYAVHHDPNLWMEPSKFEPERFINEKNEATWPPYLIPFSVGPRQCIGKSFADMFLKIFIAGLLHQFNFNFSNDHPEPNLERANGLTTHPYPYFLTFAVRKY
ncbi:hypothetical protein CHUAL_002960 [Chamberlinius hualienensis]|uniref:Cytochrome P450 3201E1 n=1 Tax=Chamberlinius hualienensis TaxID=1551368 RepID=A0A1J1E3N6_9MYRI|nr:cytochrome P450 3201E1 [Chamberlinius hualienensis]